MRRAKPHPKTRCIGYHFYGNFEEAEAERVLQDAYRAGTVVAFDTGRGHTVWFEGPPGAALRAVRDAIRTVVDASVECYKYKCKKRAITVEWNKKTNRVDALCADHAVCPDRIWHHPGTRRGQMTNKKKDPYRLSVNEIVELLIDLEWVGGIHGYHCQICSYNHDLGHDPRCPLVKLFPKTKVFKPGRGWDKKWGGLDRYRP